MWNRSDGEILTDWRAETLKWFDIWFDEKLWPWWGRGFRMSQHILDLCDTTTANFLHEIVRRAGGAWDVSSLSQLVDMKVLSLTRLNSAAVSNDYDDFLECPPPKDGMLYNPLPLEESKTSCINDGAMELFRPDLITPECLVSQMLRTGSSKDEILLRRWNVCLHKAMTNAIAGKDVDKFKGNGNNLCGKVRIGENIMFGAVVGHGASRYFDVERVSTRYCAAYRKIATNNMTSELLSLVRDFEKATIRSFLSIPDKPHHSSLDQIKTNLLKIISDLLVDSSIHTGEQDRLRPFYASMVALGLVKVSSGNDAFIEYPNTTESLFNSQKDPWEKFNKECLDSQMHESIFNHWDCKSCFWEWWEKHLINAEILERMSDASENLENQYETRKTSYPSSAIGKQEYESESESDTDIKNSSFDTSDIQAAKERRLKMLESFVQWSSKTLLGMYAGDFVTARTRKYKGLEHRRCMHSLDMFFRMYEENPEVARYSLPRIELLVATDDIIRFMEFVVRGWLDLDMQISNGSTANVSTQTKSSQVHYESKAGLMDRNDLCSICFQPLRLGTSFRLTCGHNFCRSCITQDIVLNLVSLLIPIRSGLYKHHHLACENKILSISTIIYIEKNREFRVDSGVIVQNLNSLTILLI